MVATDVMSRGIDIKGIDLVMNYDVPGDAEDYVHRIGRTARAKTEGMAVTLISQEDMFKFSKIERLIERELDKEQPPKTLGPGPEWREPQRGKKGRGAKKPQGRKSEAKSQEKKQSRPARNEGTADRPNANDRKPQEKKDRKPRKKAPSKYQMMFDALPNPKGEA